MSVYFSDWNTNGETQTKITLDRFNFCAKDKLIEVKQFLNGFPQYDGHARIFHDSLTFNIDFHRNISDCHYIAKLPSSNEINLFLAIWIDLTTNDRDPTARANLFIRITNKSFQWDLLDKMFPQGSILYDEVKNILSSMITNNKNKFDINISHQLKTQSHDKLISIINNIIMEKRSAIIT